MSDTVWVVIAGAIGGGIWMFITIWRMGDDQHWLDTRSDEYKQFLGLETVTGFDGKQHVTGSLPLRHRIRFSLVITAVAMCFFAVWSYYVYTRA